LNYEEDRRDYNVQEEENEGGEEEEVIKEKPLHFKYLDLLKNQLKMEKDIEIQRECLFSHENFSAIDTFKFFDQDNKGYITEADLENVQETHQINFIDPKIVINIFDRDRDGQMNFNEFTKSITPKNPIYLGSSVKRFQKPNYDQ
jgi:hypothetical protein